jgi:hypothetical protein
MGVGSHTFWTQAILTAVFRGIYQCLQENSGIAFPTGYGNLIRNALQFTVKLNVDEVI